MVPLRFVAFAVLLAFALLGLNFAAIPVHAATIEVSGSITADTTWTSGNVYVVTNHVTVESSATLTIQPGAIIKFHPNKLLGVKGVLKVLGTVAAPVIFTSLKDDTAGGDTNGDGNATAADKGDWGHIAFLDTSVDAENLIEHAEIRYGGYFWASGYEYYGCWRCEFFGSIRFDTASPTVRDSKVRESRAYALSASIDSFPVVRRNALQNNQGNGLEIRGGTLATVTPITKRWSNTDVVYVLTDHATIDSGVTLAINAGVKVKIAPNKLLGVKGVLKVLGTATAPVTFTSLKDDTVGGDTNGDGSATAPTKGDWAHIVFLDASVDAENLIEHAVVRYGGYMLSQGYDYYGCWRCEYFGSIRFDAASSTVRDSKVEESRAYALSASIDSFPVVRRNTLVNNQGNGLEIRGGTLATMTPIVKRWSNTDVVYVLTDHATIDSGVTLAIDAGVKIKIAPNKLLGVKGVLKVLGTTASPVIFTSLKDDTVLGDTNGDGNATAAAKGDWAHIAFFDSSVDAENLVEHAIIRYGGYMLSQGYDYYGCWRCEYFSSIHFNAASPTVRGSRVEGSRAYALSASIDSFPVVSGNSLVNNEGNGLEIRGGTLATTTPIVKRWSNTDVVYVLTGNATVESGVTLAIDAGVKVKIAPNKLMNVNGVLQVLGTAASPVTFTSLKDDSVGGDTNGDGNATAAVKGDWGHIAFLDASVDAENLIEHAIFRYGGYFNANWTDYLGSIRFYAASPTVRKSKFEESWSYALSASLDSFPVVSGNTLVNNQGNGLEIRGGTLATTTPIVKRWSNTSVVYVLTDNATIDSGVTLAIDAGVKVKIAPNKLIGVNGVLKVLGTAASPVRFTSLKDDAVGGDTNGDGNATAAAKGDWGHIAFLDASVDAENLIEYAVVRYSDGSIRFETASPTVRNSTIARNLHGLLANASQPLLVCNNIYDNDNYGFSNETPATVVNATDQWWGAVSGPYHATNPGGAGNLVSDGVNFNPWRTSACGMPPAAPSDLQALGLSTTHIMLAWVDNAADESEYRIERAAAGANPAWAEIATVAENVVTFNDGVYTCSSAQMQYRVRAYRAADQVYSEYSNVAAGASAPCAPTNLQATLSGPTTASLSWQDASPDETEFRIERSEDNGATWTPIATVAGNATAYADAGLQCSTVYGYRTQAFRAGDEIFSDYSNVAAVRTPPCAATGAAASILPNLAVELVWQDNSGDESEFQVERRVEGVSNWSPLGMAPADSQSYVDSSTQCSTQPFYRVRAYRAADAQASADYSNEATVRTAPCAPSALNAQAVSTSEILLTWMDNANDESEFLIEYMQVGGTSWQQSGALPANSIQSAVAGLNCETAYSFRLRAHRGTDDMFSLYSDVVSATTQACLKLALPLVQK